MSIPLDRPIRVVMFGGPYLQPGAVEFAALLENHADIDLQLILCQAEGSGFRHRWANLWKRRGATAIPVLGLEAATLTWRFLRGPAQALSLRRRAAPALAKIQTCPDVHAASVLQRIEALRPDLGVIYGAPILKPELFQIPTFGTLGIHHGRVPEYRGKKTTFWEMYHGEAVAGVTIQRVNPGIDTGDIARTGEVAIGNKGYSRVEREVELLGFDLYLDAILAVRKGSTSYRPQAPESLKIRKFRQPSPTDLMRFYLRRMPPRRRTPRQQ